MQCYRIVVNIRSIRGASAAGNWPPFLEIVMSSPSHATPANESKAKSVFRVVSGNFLEMYDFMVYGYYASAIAKTYFPSGNEFASLMLSLSVFGAGFLMRPIGAIVLGAYIDHHGRRKGLILTLDHDGDRHACWSR